MKLVPIMPGRRLSGGGALRAAPQVVARVDSALTPRDRLGALRVRWGIGRNRYRVEPGLYAIGNPRPESPVLVTANYKLTFDTLRAALPGIDAWILVLDTGGINVWCAAGKGSFGTAEIEKRVRLTGLERAVSDRRLILPQLGAVGVSAVEVKARTGFSVRYGPVRAQDIPAYLAAGGVKNPEMSRVRFGFRERLLLVPMELSGAKMFFPILAAAAAGLDLIANGRLTADSAAFAAALIGSLLAGTAGVPLLLPWLPFRAFALKGAAAGLLWSWLALAFLPVRPLAGVGLALFMTAAASFLGMNFTGAATYTSQSGVAREVKIGLPLQAGAAAVGTILLIIGIVI